MSMEKQVEAAGRCGLIIADLMNHLQGMDKARPWIVASATPMESRSKQRSAADFTSEVSAAIEWAADNKSQHAFAFTTDAIRRTHVRRYSRGWCAGLGHQNPRQGWLFLAADDGSMLAASHSANTLVRDSDVSVVQLTSLIGILEVALGFAVTGEMSDTLTGVGIATLDPMRLTIGYPTGPSLAAYSDYRLLNNQCRIATINAAQPFGTSRWAVDGVAPLIVPFGLNRDDIYRCRDWDPEGTVWEDRS